MRVSTLETRTPISCAWLLEPGLWVVVIIARQGGVFTNWGFRQLVDAVTLCFVVTHANIANRHHALGRAEAAQSRAICIRVPSRRGPPNRRTRASVVICGRCSHVRCAPVAVGELIPVWAAMSVPHPRTRGQGERTPHSDANSILTILYPTDGGLSRASGARISGGTARGHPRAEQTPAGAAGTPCDIVPRARVVNAL